MITKCENFAKIGELKLTNEEIELCNQLISRDEEREKAYKDQCQSYEEQISGVKAAMAAMTTGLPDSSDYTIVDGNRIILKTDLEKDINKL